MPPKTHDQARFSVRAESLTTRNFSDFSARLLGLNPFPCNRQFDFKWKCVWEGTCTFVDTNPNNYMRIEFVV